MSTTPWQSSPSGFSSMSCVDRHHKLIGIMSFWEVKLYADDIILYVQVYLVLRFLSKIIVHFLHIVSREEKLHFPTMVAPPPAEWVKFCQCILWICSESTKETLKIMITALHLKICVQTASPVVAVLWHIIYVGSFRKAELIGSRCLVAI